MKSHPFELSKWYMDCVSPEGDAVLAYAADLRWRKLHVSYDSVLEMRGDGAPTSRTSITPHVAPTVGGSRISWRSAPLGIDARWCQSAPAIRETIYESAAGSIGWSCILPAGAARIETSAGVLTGHGYVEHLHMSVAPWRLPIRSLRWGRISAEDDSIVWIRWAGPFQATFVYVGGNRVAAAFLDDERLDLADGTSIALDRRRTLRHGVLGTTIGASVPALRRLGPVRILGADECKWLSRATLQRPGRQAKDAWAIHELVTWPKTTVRRSA